MEPITSAQLSELVLAILELQAKQLAIFRILRQHPNIGPQEVDAGLEWAKQRMERSDLQNQVLGSIDPERLASLLDTAKWIPSSH